MKERKMFKFVNFGIERSSKKDVLNWSSYCNLICISKLESYTEENVKGNYHHFFKDEDNSLNLFRQSHNDLVSLGLVEGIGINKVYVPKQVYGIGKKKDTEWGLKGEQEYSKIDGKTFLVPKSEFESQEEKKDFYKNYCKIWYLNRELFCKLFFIRLKQKQEAIKVIIPLCYGKDIEKVKDTRLKKVLKFLYSKNRKPDVISLDEQIPSEHIKVLDHFISNNHFFDLLADKDRKNLRNNFTRLNIFDILSEGLKQLFIICKDKEFSKIYNCGTKSGKLLEYYDKELPSDTKLSEEFKSQICKLVNTNNKIVADDKLIDVYDHYTGIKKVIDDKKKFSKMVKFAKSLTKQYVAKK